MKNYYKDYESEMIQKAYEYSQKLKLNISKGTRGYNDEADGFRHAFVHANLTYNYGELASKIIGNEHEMDFHKSAGMPDDLWKKEKNMDLWNNAIGREIGEEVRKELKGMEKYYTKEQIEDKIALKINQRIKSGDLITNLEDKRDFKKSYYSGHLHTREDIGKMKPETFKMYEKGIMKQMEEKGIPSKTNTGKTSSEDGHWVTIDGNHVFIKN